MPATPRAALADRLHSAAIHLLRRLRRQDEAMGLTPARASALSVVVFGGPVTLGQLARAEQVAPPTMTRLAGGAAGREGPRRGGRAGPPRRVVGRPPPPRGARLLGAGRRARVAALARDLAALDRDDLELLARAADLLERVSTRSPRR